MRKRVVDILARLLLELLLTHRRCLLHTYTAKGSKTARGLAGETTGGGEGGRIEEGDNLPGTPARKGRTEGRIPVVLTWWLVTNEQARERPNDCGEATEAPLACLSTPDQT